MKDHVGDAIEDLETGEDVFKSSTHVKEPPILSFSQNEFTSIAITRHILSCPVCGCIDITLSVVQSDGRHLSASPDDEGSDRSKDKTDDE